MGNWLLTFLKIGWSWKNQDGSIRYTPVCAASHNHNKTTTKRQNDYHLEPWESWLSGSSTTRRKEKSALRLGRRCRGAKSGGMKACKMGWQLGTLFFSIGREIQAPNYAELQFPVRLWVPRLLWGETELSGIGSESEGGFLAEVLTGIIVTAWGCGTQGRGDAETWRRGDTETADWQP
uniref:Uncharacterized protein n=1 Tax=Myotis myotis TaxID=51298 RepID=A0A7J8AMK7_MYOMY|nr:hypothetical protein mMyoMyo1_008076 [Myotis myotis]